MRLATMTRLRWLSVAGQSAACIYVAWGLWFPFPVFACFALIALSAALNVWLGLRFPKGHRLGPKVAALILAFDIVQPAGLLFLTGGITNPFALFLILPAIVAAATQPAATTLLLSAVTIVLASVLAFVHLPLPWAAGEIMVFPATYLGGLWFAIVTTIAFACFYVHQVAAEARQLADALNATELVLEREQHLTTIDGLAAAAAHELGTPLGTIAVVAREMNLAIPQGHPLREDVELLGTQTQRCRDILRRLTNPVELADDHVRPVSLTALVHEAAAPHLDTGVTVNAAAVTREGPEPTMVRNAGIVYGLGNILENAVDFARDEVRILFSWDRDEVRVSVRDDGEGFSPEALARIGDPYLSRRGAGAHPENNLGLGLFIAKTLLERSGASLHFGNRDDAEGAVVDIVWPRSAMADGRLKRNARTAPLRPDETYDGTDAVAAQ